MKRLNKLKGMYALLIAVAALIGITIYYSCSTDEDYDYGYHSVGTEDYISVDNNKKTIILGTYLTTH